MTFASILLIVASCVSAYASDGEARWIRKANISPDGKTVAFSYQGDIFTVPAEGGKAFQVTSNAAYDSNPIWTPDGKQIVFTSNRELSQDIWIIPSHGGKATRLTTYPGSETPLTVTPDGKVIFSANIQTDPVYDGFPGGEPQTWAVGLGGGKPELLSPIPMCNASVSADGTILFEDYKGYEDPLRKHHTSSVTRDIWKYTPGTRKTPAAYTQLTFFKGEDRNPVFSADGKTYYYTSESDSKGQGAAENFNIWKSSILPDSKPEQVTFLNTHPVRNISVSRDGKLLFSYNGDLYILEGQTPVKLSISVTTDSNERESVRREISSGASALAASPNGKEIAIVAHGDVFVIAPDQKVTKRITNTPSQERGVSFSEDGRTLYYAAERNGHWGIWKTELKDKGDKYFAFSNFTEESLFTRKGETCFQPSVSPDGKWVAFLRDRTELVIRSTKGDREKSLYKGVNYSYTDGDLSFEWAPDSQSILTTCMENGGWNNVDIALIDIKSGKVTNLTQSGYNDSGFRWAMGGKAIIWASDRDGYRSHGSWGAEDDIYMMFFDPKTYAEFIRSKEDESIAKLLAPEPKKKDEKKDSTKVDEKKVELMLEGRENRKIRLTQSSSRLRDFYLTADGKSLYYFSNGNLCVMDTKEGDIDVIRKHFSGGFEPSADGKTLWILGNGISKLNTSNNRIENISFKSEYDYKSAEEREYIFDHCWKQVNEKFYDSGIHGVNWDLMRVNYRQFLPYINNNYDFQDLLSEMLGELNGSHTGARYRARNGVNAGHIGVLYDLSHEGKGLKIAEVLPDGPLYNALPSVKAGDTILAIDGETIEQGANWYDVLLNKAGKRILIKVKTSKGTEEVYLKATSSDSDLLYKRWVRQREEMVEKLSGGRLAYVHVEGMNSPSFREVYSKLLGKYRSAEAVIVDTRHNGGGWLHDDLATLLSGKAYVEFRPRGQYIGTEPYSKWTKPSCVLVGEDNYSDASGFPYVYKTLGIGKIIGAPVPGTMTAVWWENQIDPSLVFGIPQVTSWGLKEDRPLENLQLEPDILVKNTPESQLEGKDYQLEVAVKEMLNELDRK